MPARPAGDDDDPVDLGEEARGDPHRVLAEAPGLERELVPDRLDDDRRLLGDLLRHEVGVAPLFGGDGVPRDASGRPAPGRAVEAGHLDRGRRQPHEVAVLEEDEVARVRKERRGVGGDEVLVRAEAEDDRGAVLGDVEDVRLVGRKDDDGVHPGHPRQDGPHDLAERGPGRVGAPRADRLRDDLRVGLRRERDAAREQLPLDGEEVLDDPVVDDDDPTRRVAVRVGVLLRRPAVRRPAGVADARPAGKRPALDPGREVPELPLAPGDAEEAVRAEDGDARRVVAAVLEAPQAVDQDRRRLPRSDVSDDPAHRPTPSVPSPRSSVRGTSPLPRRSSSAERARWRGRRRGRPS